MSHHPKLLTTYRYGCWAECSCGWISLTYREKLPAQLAFGDHLAEVSRLHRLETTDAPPARATDESL